MRLFSIIMVMFTEFALGDVYLERRFMSLTIRDQALSVEEAKSLDDGSQNLEALITTWLDSEDHIERVKRYFNDQFGAGMDFATVQDSFILESSGSVYYLIDKGRCADSEVIEVTDAWWLRDGESIRVCLDTRSDQIVYQYNTKANVYCNDSGPTGIGASECGCGPQMIMCYPRELVNDLRDAMRFEFKERAGYVYENDLSWFELLGGDFFYGNRLLYKHYIDQQGLFRNYLLSINDLANLLNLPLDQPARAPFPEVGRVTRAGLATSPIFLRQYNNFRSRINILTARLLCQDVDSTLNTDGIAQWVNSELSEFDQAHGTDPGCSECHYPMDNMGSALLYWGPQGWYQYYGAIGEQNEAAHAFGLRGTGPSFLIEAYTGEARFLPCMAKLVFEDFTGARFEDLSESRQSELANLAASGPRALIRGVLTSQEIRVLHREGLMQPTIGGESVYDFEEDVNPILRASCSGGTCHSTGTILGSQYEFVDQRDQFAIVPLNRITDGSMPPENSPLSISDSDRAILESWRENQ